MRWFGTILYLLLWLIFLTLSVILFPRSESILIPIFLFVAAGAWIYGRSAGLVIIFFGLFHLYLLTSFIYGDLILYYENRLSGLLLGISIVLLVSSLRSRYDALRTANAHLDQSVAVRSAELRNLTAQLLNDAEATRIRHGQALHDGIGQQLTGIQLYCTSLAEQLSEENSPNAPLLSSMRSKTKSAHDIIRKTARMLFPVRMHETGLIRAVNELVSCLNEMDHMSVLLKVDGDFLGIPEEIALGLYRICHESAMCAATALKASDIQLGIKESANDYEILLQHNGSPRSPLHENMEQRVILYRVQALQGTLSSNQSVNGTVNIIYRIPKL